MKTTEVMHYRRYLARRNKEKHAPAAGAQRSVWRTAGVSDGRGFVFHLADRGDLPSGFLAVSAGKLRGFAD